MPGTVTVTVQDASSVPPRPLPVDATRPGGFGWSPAPMNEHIDALLIGLN
ncbi:hypothetical protein ABZZ80_24175 [Streptomyces sp. NPDC006356]